MKYGMVTKGNEIELNLLYYQNAQKPNDCVLRIVYEQAPVRFAVTNCKLFVRFQFPFNDKVFYDGEVRGPLNI